MQMSFVFDGDWAIYKPNLLFFLSLFIGGFVIISLALFWPTMAWNSSGTSETSRV